MKKREIDDREIINIARECSKLLSSKKASDVLLMDLRKINSYLDYFIIATGNSFVHCRALAKELQKFFWMSFPRCILNGNLLISSLKR